MIADHCDSLAPRNASVYLTSEYQDDPGARRLAETMCERIFEVKQRNIRTSTVDFGFAFATNAELTDYVLRNASGKTILSLAGAAGEEMILAALAGAKRVVNNDINQGEIDQFTLFRGMAPTDLQSKIEDSCCDCLDLPTRKPDLIGQCDFIVCNNLIHFFSAEQLAPFFNVVRALLAPNAQIIFTANAITSDVLKDTEMRTSLRENPFQTYIHEVLCFLRPRGEWRTTKAYSDGEKLAEQNPSLLLTAEGKARLNKIVNDGLQQVLYQKRYISDKKNVLRYKTYRVLQKKKENGKVKWTIHQEAINAFTSDVAPIGREILPDITKIYKSDPRVKECQEGDIDILKTYTLQYMPIAFKQIFKDNGFEIVTSVVINPFGHIIPGLSGVEEFDDQTLEIINEDIHKEPLKVGIIARIP